MVLALEMELAPSPTNGTVHSNRLASICSHVVACSSVREKEREREQRVSETASMQTGIKHVTSRCLMM